MPEPVASDAHATAAARLRAAGQRYTPARRALVEALATAGRPLTIPEVRAVDRRLALSSAYRNLAVLERAGIVHRIVTSDEHARFELAEGLTEHHHHLVCDRCGRVDDFTVSEEVERWLEAALADAVAGTGFVPDHHRLDLVGTCPDCR